MSEIGTSAPGPTPPRASAKPRRSGFWPLRDLPTLGWLVAVVIVALLHRSLPAPRWLLIHLLLLGAVSHSVLVWSRHFTDAVLHAAPRPGDRRGQAARLAMLNLGTVLVVLGVTVDRWPATLVGATAIAVAVGWHGVALVRMLRSALPARFGLTVHYYVAAATTLPVGAALGAWMTHGTSESTHERVMVAHVTLNLLGWLGLTVLGTLVTLWPTMLRTRIVDGAETAATRALPVLIAGIGTVLAASLLDQTLLAALGLAIYLAGIVVLAVPFVRTARARPPSAFPTLSVLAGVAWLVGTLAILVVGLATASGWMAAHDRLTQLTPALAAGFAAQVLLGALSYLIPVVLGGGAAAVRAANAVLDRAGPLRVTMVNAGLLAALSTESSPVRVLGSALVLLGLAIFVPLAGLAVRAALRAKADPKPGARLGPAPVRPRGQANGLAVAGLALGVLAAAAGIAIDPGHGGATTVASASGGVVATGHTTSVVVAAKDIRFSPSRIEVPAGDRLVITVHNTDSSQTHDLVLKTGATTGRLAPGETGRLDAGVVGHNLSGWCSVVGHRQMGMVLQVVVTGADAATRHTATTSPSRTGTGSAAAKLDFSRSPSASFVAHPAELPPLSSDRVHRQTFTVRDVVTEVAPGVTQTLWTYNGTAPGPVLHGRVGDTFEITVVNHGDMAHSIDFHAGSLAPDGPMRQIPVGGSLVYRFTASKAGIWLYHCSTMPMSVHIANGMFGAVVIDPPGLPPVAHQYVMVQSELYLGAQGGPADADKVAAERPDAAVFNGVANQYDARPLTAKAGERVRVWFVDAGPSLPTAFHIVGGQFDTVYSEGGYLLRRGVGAAGGTSGGSQALALDPAQGGFVELAFPQAGTYPFVSHFMVDAERGAHGLFKISP